MSEFLRASNTLFSRNQKESLSSGKVITEDENLTETFNAFFNDIEKNQKISNGIAIKDSTIYHLDLIFSITQNYENHLSFQTIKNVIMKTQGLFSFTYPHNKIC